MLSFERRSFMNEKKSEQLGLRIAPDVKDAYKAF